MAFDINKTFLSKKIKKTSRRKQWITFFVILFSIFLLLGQATRASFKIENYPELKILQEEEDSIASLFNSNQYRFYYGKPTEFKANLVGENGIIKFYPLESGEIIPVFESGREPINNYFYGRLIDLPEEMLAEIKSSLLENHEFLDENNTDWFVQNKMFEVIEEPSFDLFFTILISIILAYALWIWIRSRHFKRDPQKHPTFKAFAREGGELENFHQFNNEIESGDVRRFKYVVLTQNWLFYNGKFRLKLRHINDIVCAFKTKPVNNSLITRWASSKRDIVIGFIDKKQWAI
ncbi:MAG: hypothetical protein FWE47_02920, partial [Oscillospiraceae bacterium]|nr:hypothetical protein [Oscillospiraceae bacterium]